MSDVALILMAAGAARRMGGAHKLLMEWRGAPIVSHAAHAARESGLSPLILVTGRDADGVTQAAGEGFLVVRNPRFADGFGTSLATGVAALMERAPATKGVVIALADMPLVSGGMMRGLADAFAQQGGRAVIRAAHRGAPGNPVVLPASLFAAMTQLHGDEGARGLIAEAGLATVLIEAGRAALADVDTPEAFAALDGFQEDAR
jgi:molybdenum cofactor cytidylyltransferase